MSTTLLRAPSLEHFPRMVRLALRSLERLNTGRLLVQLPDGGEIALGREHQPAALIRLHNWNLFGAVVRSGDIGLAQTYIAQDWSTPDLPALLKLLIANRESLDSLIYGSWWGRLAYRLRHALNRNTRTNSRRNIQAHYDLGNDFYRLWLDATMNYSSAWFQGDLSSDLEQAQHAKVRRALLSAGVGSGSRVLEIGIGWGALAEKATSELGAHVTGVTLSDEQLAWARRRLDAAGLATQSDLRLQDYRDINDAPFDAICSIEMVEAVGESYWPTYFQTIHRLLKPGGRACVQSIVIDDTLFERYRGGTDFIQQYIFPGGCLPSRGRFIEEARRAGLTVVESFAFGRDYAETLRRWAKAFQKNREAVLRQGFDQRFMQTWAFYLAYCEAGFDSGNLDVIQFTLTRD